MNDMILLLAAAQAGKYPMIDRVAAAIVQKYQTSSCQQLAAERAAPPSAQKQAMKAKIGQKLQSDAAMRAALVSQIAAPVVDKMIACGFEP